MELFNWFACATCRAVCDYILHSCTWQLLHKRIMTCMNVIQAWPKSQDTVLGDCIKIYPTRQYTMLALCAIVQGFTVSCNCTVYSNLCPCHSCIHTMWRKHGLQRIGTIVYNTTHSYRAPELLSLPSNLTCLHTPTDTFLTHTRYA